LLAEQAQALQDAGLHRLNISLDTLDAETFQRISRRTGLEQVLAGIAAARQAGFRRIRLNAVAIRGLSEADILPLGRFARAHDLELRFIEFMPLDADGNWQPSQVLSGATIRSMLERELGRLLPLPIADPSQPAVDFQFADGCGRIGFINPVTQPFCGNCNRLRLTAEGKVRNCLFSRVEWDAREILRNGGSDAELIELVQDCIGTKRAGHGIDSTDFIRPERAMYQIGG
jgi:cyclic pyranopterin phosphate synthase